VWTLRGGASAASRGRTGTRFYCVSVLYRWCGAGATSMRPGGTARPRQVRAGSPACAVVALQYAMSTKACFAIVRTQPVCSPGGEEQRGGTSH